MQQIKATIFFERKFWIATFERLDQEGFAVARHIFGGEPTDPEVYAFVLEHYAELNFGPPQKFELEIRRLNPKRMQRQVKREMERVKETAKPSTFAQDYMREELERKKKERKCTTRADKEARKEAKFEQKQTKRKAKRKGH